ncbi:MAG TPA: MFS transporter, partial [Spirochaetota bacterium]|nr:MFS transporter [Spirochaetota bacterium]
MTHLSRVPKFILLFTLYLSQGLPFGFQATALPVFLRSSGVSLADIGFVSALALPWMLKALWAPAVDRYWSARLGRRRTWLLPLQALMVITMVAASRTAPGADLGVLLGLVFCMNLFAATQDIAVDGLAVDILAPEELGPGNAAQVVGYKTGMVLGGGVMLWLNARLSWEGLFFAMALIAAVPLALLVPLKETGKGLAEKTRLGLSAIIRQALEFFTLKNALWGVLLIMSYKIGEVAIDVMFKPFLVDAGFRPADIGLWVGTWGMGASLAGSLLGGWLVKKTSIVKGLALALALRIVPLVMEWW